MCKRVRVGYIASKGCVRTSKAALLASSVVVMSESIKLEIQKNKRSGFKWIIIIRFDMIGLQRK